MSNILTKSNKKRALWFLALTAAYFCALGLFYWLVRGDWYRAVKNVDSVTRGFTTAELKAGMEARQKLDVPVDYMMELTVEVNRWSEDADARIGVSVMRQEDTLWSQSFAYGDIDGDGRLRCEFEEPLATNGKPITLIVSAQGGLALWCGDTRAAGRFVAKAGDAGSLTVDGEALSGQLVVTAYGYDQFNVLPYFWPFALALYAALAALGIRQAKKKNSLLHRAVTVVRRYQYLLRQLVMRDFRVKYQASVLGVLWSFLNPMLMTFVYYVVFSTIFKSTVENFIIYLMSGIILFNYFSEASSLSLTSVVTNAHLITKVYIPKYIFPISKIISSAINLTVSFLPLFAVMLVTGTPFRKSLLLIPLLLIFLIAFTMGMGLILSALDVFFRDIQFLWSVLISIWNFATPIFYPDTIIPQAYQTLYRLNPMYHICSFSRMIIMNGASPVPSTYLACFVSSFGVLALGLYVYYKSQDKFFLYL